MVAPAAAAMKKVCTNTSTNTKILTTMIAVAVTTTGICMIPNIITRILTMTVAVAAMTTSRNTATKISPMRCIAFSKTMPRSKGCARRFWP